jgi:hypothetical protein
VQLEKRLGNLESVGGAKPYTREIVLDSALQSYLDTHGSLIYQPIIIIIIIIIVIILKGLKDTFY